MTTTRITQTAALLLLLSVALLACGPEDEKGPPGGSTSGATSGATTDLLTLQTCTTSIADDVPAFYKKYFKCVTITTSASGVIIESNGQPPHKSYYYGSGNPNFEDFDYTRGAEYRPNPNKIATFSLKIEVPNQPTAKGVTATAANVDGVVGTSTDEYPMGLAGLALDSVALYNPLAGPGDNIEEEKYTFDNYQAHPMQTGQYHYHTATPGPLEVLAAAGLTTSTTPGAAAVELYGVMCDGSLVLGCTELDGSAIQGSDTLDAQNGHSHDISDADATHFTNRYHTHICDGQGHKFTPEIQTYSTCTLLSGGLR
jgi:hypothetical protein